MNIIHEIKSETTLCECIVSTCYFILVSLCCFCDETCIDDNDVEIMN